MMVMTDGSVVVNSSAVFDAPEILLQAGFEVPLGAEFTTILVGCGGSGLRSGAPDQGEVRIIDANGLKAEQERLRLQD